MQNDTLNKPDESSETPWYKIYIFIIAFNAVLVVLFYLLKAYFNISGS